MQHTSNKHLEYKNKIIPFIKLSENSKYMGYILPKMCQTSTFKTTVQILLRNYRRSKYMKQSTMFMDWVTKL